MLFYWLAFAVCSAIGLIGLRKDPPTWALPFTLVVAFAPSVILWGLAVHFPSKPTYRIDGTQVPPPKWGVFGHRACEFLAWAYIAVQGALTLISCFAPGS